MIRFLRPLSCLLLSAGLLSCVQRLPDAATMDRYYKAAEVQAQPMFEELERQRAQGKMDDYTYNVQKAAIQNSIGQKAAELAWTAHDLNEKSLEVHGIPTPDHPTDIDVPQAGSMPTGSDYHRFNQSDVGNQTSNTMQTMRSIMSDTRPGANIRQQSGPTGY